MAVKHPIKLFSKELCNIVKINADCIDACNYNCEYCYNMKNGHVRTNKILDLSKLYNFASWISNRTDKTVLTVLLGGEPTLHPQFLDLCKKTNKNFKLLSFSNFSKPYEFFEETAKFNVKYLLTFHYADNRVDSFIQKLNKLRDAKMLHCIDVVNVMLNAQHFNECLKVYDMLYSNYGSRIRCNLIDDHNKDDFQKSRLSNYTHEQLAQYTIRCNQSSQDKDITVVFNDGTQETMNDYSIKNNPDYKFKHWKCDAGRSFFNVTINGDIMSCCFAKTKLATLDSYKCIQFKPTLCMSNKCPYDEYGIERQKLIKT